MSIYQSLGLVLFEGIILLYYLESTLGCFAAKFSLKTPSIDNH